MASIAVLKRQFQGEEYGACVAASIRTLRCVVEEKKGERAVAVFLFVKFKKESYMDSSAAEYR